MRVTCSYELELCHESDHQFNPHVFSHTTSTRVNIYRVCPRRKVPDFGRVFLMLKYADITQNTFVQSWTVMEIMTREKHGLLVGSRTVPVSWQVLSKFVLECSVRWRLTLAFKLHMCFLQGTLHCAVSHVTSVLGIHVACIVLGTLRTTLTWRSSYSVVQINCFMSLTSYFDVTYITNITETTQSCPFWNIFCIQQLCNTCQFSNFSDHYLPNRSTLDIGVLGYRHTLT
jgi:hypothetical protein